MSSTASQSHSNLNTACGSGARAVNAAPEGAQPASHSVAKQPATQQEAEQLAHEELLRDLSRQQDDLSVEGMPAAAKIRWFRDLRLRDTPIVGGKNAALGELTHIAKRIGIRVPQGFALPAAAFQWFMESTGAAAEVAALLEPALKAGSEHLRVERIEHAAAAAREAILSRPLPESIRRELVAGYRTLDAQSAPGDARPPLVAVRSSASAEDLPGASFAGAQETFLQVQGEAELIDACHRCFASLYTARAVHYRSEKGIAEQSVALSVGVQRMVDPSRGASGVLFTLDTESGARNVVLVNAVPGLGEALVQGEVVPEEYLLFKPALESAPSSVLYRKLCGAPASDGLPGCASAATAPPAQSKTLHPARNALPNTGLTDEVLRQLGLWGCAIEEHFSRAWGADTPMDIEWVWEGPGFQPAIVQARPETVHSGTGANGWYRYTQTQAGKVLVEGTSVGTKIAHGQVRILRSPSQIGSFQKGDTLVAEKTDPDWEPLMRMASGIVTERGGRTCHAAIVSRELGVPAIVGAADATDLLREGTQVTLNCARGETGEVYEGRLAFTREWIPAAAAKPTRTKLTLNIADPDRAFRLAQLPSDGVGLVREEFLLAGQIGVHPLALLHFESLPLGIRTEVERRTDGAQDKSEFFIERLSEGIARIAAAFHPRPVLLRLSDLKSNEYAQLTGGALFERTESNPMLGFRGASRYCHPSFQAAFAMECEAVLRARERFGLKNLRVMIPFCRLPKEGEAVLKAMGEAGLVRGRDGLEVWMMCEIPSNVLLAAEFCGLFDGFSIGSNDLTQLTLGVDRDSEQLSALFDEKNPAVTGQIERFIQIAHAHHKPVGICGEAPSRHADFTAFLVHVGIDSISVDPDAFQQTREWISCAENAPA